MAVEIIDLPEDTASTNDMYVVVYRDSAGSQKSRRIARLNFLDDVALEGGDPTFGDVTADNLIATASLAVGATQITSILKDQLSVTASTLAANATEDKTAALSGAATGDIVHFSITGLAAGLQVLAWVSAADTITFRITNVTGSSITGATYTADTMAIRAT